MPPPNKNPPALEREHWARVLRALLAGLKKREDIYTHAELVDGWTKKSVCDFICAENKKKTPLWTCRDDDKDTFVLTLRGAGMRKHLKAVLDVEKLLTPGGASSVAKKAATKARVAAEMKEEADKALEAAVSGLAVLVAAAACGTDGDTA